MRSFATDSTTLRSVGPAGGNGPFHASAEQLSADGARVIFSTSESLVSGDTDSRRDLYERVGTTTTLLSTGAAGGNGPHDVTYIAGTPDATHVLFRTDEQLVAADTSPGADLYERAGSVTSLLTTGPNGGGCGGYAFCQATISDAGNRVVLTTAATLTASDTDSQPDIYERAGGSTSLLSTGPSGGNGAFPAFRGGVSADHTVVTFFTDEQLVPEDADSQRDAYLSAGGSISLVSTGPSGGNGAFPTGFASVAHDGSRLWFVTEEQLTPDDTDGTKRDIYERRGSTTKLITRNTPLGSPSPPLPADPVLEGASTDGRRVFFTTANQLTADDTDPPNGCFYDDDGDLYPKSCTDLYMYDADMDAFSLVSTGPGAGGAYDIEFGSEVNADGTRAFFITREPILGQDAACSCIDVYERTLGPVPQTFLLTKGPTGGFGAHDAFGPDIEVNVGTSRDGRRYYFYTHEQLTSADTDSGAADLYVSAIAEPGGYPRPRSATPMHLALVPAYAPCTSPNRTHGPPLAFESCSPPQPASPNLTVGGGGGALPANSAGYLRLDAVIGAPGPPDTSDAAVTVSLSNVMRSADLSDYTGELRATASLRMTDRDGPGVRVPGTIEDFPLGITVPCAATADTTVGAGCSVQTTFDTLVPGLAPEGMRAVQQLGQVRIEDGGSDEDAGTAGNSLFMTQGLFVP